MAYLSAGLVVGQLSLTRTRVAVGLVTTGVGLAVAASAASSILLNRYGLAHIWAAQPGSGLTVPETSELLTLGGDGTVPTSTWWWLAVDAPHTGTPFDLLDTTGTAIALLGAMLLAEQLAPPAVRRLTGAVQTPLAAAGSMTLTFYTAHITFINSDYDTYGPATGYTLQAVAVLVIGLAWRVTAGRGPLEGLVTVLSARAGRWADTGSRPPRHRLSRNRKADPGQKPTHDKKTRVSRGSIAVGTVLTGGPPHRSQRAELPHWAPASGVWRRSVTPGRGASRGRAAAIGSRVGPSGAS